MARPLGDRSKKMNEILDAADELFITKGYRGTTISDIAKKIGSAQGALYYYFSSKEEVLERLLERYVLSLMAEVMIIQDRNYDAANKVSQVLELVLKKASYKNGVLMSLLYDQDNLRMKEKIFNEIGLVLRPILKDIIEEGRKKGDFHTDSPDVAIDYILVITDYLSLVIYNKLDNDFKKRITMAETLIETTLGTTDKAIKIKCE
ncbi:MAG TPA: TetR/AcrR family transcriptional regulator [Candidatus Avacidaminococcus intestinavium]|uniref:TetR/AcrR family transcriptional regulator n=1 Tax=Candidatus Avacidaminococcus intestinavium TaxID=2840684 RepID=A0A9D1MR60_9FIRM|nr:TetR/AcrR family transcriptional regulator [Candidatus Avacidaminococcus intestinavium]